MCKCEHGMDEYSRELLEANIRLYTTIADLKKENSELKAKLEKKRIPPKGTLVRAKMTGIIGYSTGEFLDGVLWITRDKDSKNIKNYAIEWEEIEIKVKE